MKVTQRLVYGAAFAGLLTCGAAAWAQQQPVPAAAGGGMKQSGQTVFDTLSNDPRFTTTMQMAYVAGAASRMQIASNVTVFAATNDAWDASPFGRLLASSSSTGANSEFPQGVAIMSVIRGFWVRGKPSAPGSQDVTMQSVAGRAIDFDAATQTVKWVDPDGGRHSAHVSGPEIQATNGLIVPVDQVVGS